MSKLHNRLINVNIVYDDYDFPSVGVAYTGNMEHM